MKQLSHWKQGRSIRTYWSMLRKISLLGLLVVLLGSCNSNSGAEVDSDPTEDTGLSTELPTGFHEFYDAFHSDSSYQMSRVVFPLKGALIKKDTMETITVEKIYEKEDWTLHRPFNGDAGYSRTFTVLGDLVIEKLQDNMGLLTIERRWGKVDTTWSLIYYGTEERSW